MNKKIYRIISIREQDFGCEERPDEEEYCVDVIVQDDNTKENLTISVPDHILYEKQIDVGSVVFYDGNELSKYTINWQRKIKSL